MDDDSNNDEFNSSDDERDNKRSKSGEESPIPTIQNEDVVDIDDAYDFLTLSLSSANNPTAPGNPPSEVLPFLYHQGPVADNTLPPPQLLPFFYHQGPVADNTLPPPQNFIYINPPPQEFTFMNPPPPEFTYMNSQPPEFTFMNPPPRRNAARPGDPVIRQRRMKRNSGKSPHGVKSTTIPVQYPWSDVTRGSVRSLCYLRAKQISRITGEVQCKKCEQKFQMQFDLEEKFREISTFVAENKADMHTRAPRRWMSPALPKCGFCNQENSVKPVIAEKKRAINWLFLFLGQMLGCCTLDQLKYFCKHTKNHRTGAKDRVLFLAYLCICKQLDPNGPFDI